MNKLIIGTILTVGLCCANEQYTWESAQRFNDSVLKRITISTTGEPACGVTAVHKTSFIIRCFTSEYLIELPYTWGEWKIVSSGYGAVVYSNEINKQ